MPSLIKTFAAFSKRHPLLGSFCWIASLQYFIVQLIVSSRWPVAYSWGNNAISDLGNTVCGDYGPRYVCSPAHGLMNLSFIVLGLTMMSGAVFIYQSFHKSFWTLVGFTGMGLSGLGAILVGIFPENVNAVLHLSGASLAFLVGNFAVVILGFTLNVSKRIRYYTLATGIIGLIAAGLFAMNIYAGLGLGGMERLALYLQTIWLIVFGAYLWLKSTHDSV